MFDIDRLFAEWPHTLGQGGFPLTDMRGISRPPAPASSTATSGD
jgi:hypothetical protein